MGRLKWRKPWFRLALGGLALSLFFTNCDTPHQFSLTDEASLQAQGIYSFSAEFSPNTTSSLPIDLIWVIDNSGSMSNEAAHVRANFEAFASTLEQSIDFRLALISKSGNSGTNVSLPYSGVNYLQVDKTVASRNPLTLAAQAICPAGSTCGSISGNGTLTSFLRAESKKVFVIVTDDDADITADAFARSFEANYPASQLAVFGFIGKNKNCSITRLGGVYETLSSSTGGSTYDICLNDWSSTFSSLVNSLTAISRNWIQMPQTAAPIEKVLQVHVNGVLIPEGSYHFDGSILTLSPSIVNGVSGVLRVHVIYQLQMGA
ncbi:MAG: hypothetical protein KF802_05525 [Bdellovibrionaceae bacterium]|nr:hypothetical protein [Pseudobdellovibrionaceae bacterium]MBX3032382.1 hypothetical protein [Pseudobdellovibrionaceae bacterium]